MENKVYWTSRRLSFQGEVVAGWVYKLKGKESKIYDTKEEAERSLLLEGLKEYHRV